MATQLQIAVLQAIRYNDFGAWNGKEILPSDYVFIADDFCVWSNCVDCTNTSLLVCPLPTGKALSGVISTCVQAGYLTANGSGRDACLTLTKAGFDLLPATKTEG